MEESICGILVVFAHPRHIQYRAVLGAASWSMTEYQEGDTADSRRRGRKAAAELTLAFSTVVEVGRSVGRSDTGRERKGQGAFMKMQMPPCSICARRNHGLSLKATEK